MEIEIHVHMYIKHILFNKIEDFALKKLCWYNMNGGWGQLISRWDDCVYCAVWNSLLFFFLLHTLFFRPHMHIWKVLTSACWVVRNANRSGRMRWLCLGNGKGMVCVSLYVYVCVCALLFISGCNHMIKYKSINRIT